MKSAFGVEHSDAIAKADNRSSGNPSGGRRAASAAFGPYHTVAVSPKGRRMKNLAREYGAEALGQAPGIGIGAAGLGAHMAGKSKLGLGLGAAGLGAALVGGHVGRQKNLTAMNRKGYLKAES